MYADDSVIIAPSPSALQQLIYIFEMYAKDNEISFNTKKTVCMSVISSKCKGISVPRIHLNNSVLSWVESQKYLGVLLRSDLNDCNDMRRQLRAIYGKGNILLRKFKKCTESVKINLFKAYCSNLYCCQLWCHYSKDIYKDVKVSYNNVFRYMFNLRKREHVSCHFVKANVNTFNELIRKSIFSFKQRLDGSTNSVICAIINSQFFIFESKLYSCWKSRLYM